MLKIARIVLDERDEKIRLVRIGGGLREYKLTDKRIGLIVDALVKIGDSSPLTNWVFSPVKL